MPQIRGDRADTEANPAGRIGGAKQLLTTSALIMSAFLVSSSITTVALIPAAEFQPGGKANGRALAYLAHTYLGEGFGTVYDAITIAILWFAGASAMAGLLNIVPRYLPHYGMAPAWARATRPLVLVFIGIGFLITIVFQASVDKQSGAYDTGVLVLITSAAIAVTLHAREQHALGHRRRGAIVGFGVISVLFVYTTIANVIERPDGIKIAAIFILGIVIVSFFSRVVRATELRATDVTLDAPAERLLLSQGVQLRLIAHDPASCSAECYAAKLAHARAAHGLSDEKVAFLEVEIADSSDFESELEVRGSKRHGYDILTVRSPSIPNALAALALHLRTVEVSTDAGLVGAEAEAHLASRTEANTGSEVTTATREFTPHLYFRWNEGNPFANLMRFLLFGEGEIVPMAREVPREAEPDVQHRPWVHVGQWQRRFASVARRVTGQSRSSSSRIVALSLEPIATHQCAQTWHRHKKPSRRNASRRKAARSGKNWSPGLLRPGVNKSSRPPSLVHRSHAPGAPVL